jgi:hypothetical protein
MDERVVHDRDLGDEDKQDLETPLGISQEPVAADSNIRASNDADEVRQRRRRMSDGLNERTTDVADPGDPFGAKGIDMGGGGDGTDVKPSR